MTVRHENMRWNSKKKERKYQEETENEKNNARRLS